MKFIIALSCFLGMSSVVVATDFGLKKEDQLYYKNDRFDGNNKLERIDSLVREVNKLHGEINTMKADITLLKQEVEALKSKK